MNSQVICNIIMSVAFIATFIGIFFFTYAKNIEQTIVKEQTENIVKDILGDYLILLPKEVKLPLGLLSSGISAPDLKAEDEKANTHNKALLKKAFMAIIVANLVAVGLIYHFYKKQPFDVMNMVKQNGLILVFVGLTEFVFLTYIGRYYVSADPNYVKYSIVKTINEFKKEKGSVK